MTGPRIESGVTGCRVEPGMTERMPGMTERMPGVTVDVRGDGGCPGGRSCVMPDLIRHPPEQG